MGEPKENAAFYVSPYNERDILGFSDATLSFPCIMLTGIETYKRGFVDLTS